MPTIVFLLTNQDVHSLIDNLVDEEHQYEMHVKKSYVPGFKRITLSFEKKDSNYFVKKLNENYDMHLLENEGLLNNQQH